MQKLTLHALNAFFFINASKKRLMQLKYAIVEIFYGV
jgi:hypothetical protein